MIFYSRTQILGMFPIDEGFLVALEREEIIEVDAPSGGAGDFSEQMLERIRVAHNLVHELDVNLAGVAIIIRMREDLGSMRHQLEELLAEVRRARKDG
jgi:MerR family transcriptional regulator/heat shock protein HspR